VGTLVVLSGLASSVNVSTALASIDGKYSIVWGYNASDTADPWKSYVPGYGSDVNDLSNMGVEWGYWVRLNTTSATLNVSGTEPSSTSISLVSGWNLVGYPKLTSAAVATALSTIDGKYSIVWGYNASDTADPWKSYVPGYGSDVNDLSQLSAGSGYWIRVNATSATLTI
jgi:hypothetical protein